MAETDEDTLWAELKAYLQHRREQSHQAAERRRWARRCPQCACPKHTGSCPPTPFRWTA